MSLISFCHLSEDSSLINLKNLGWYFAGIFLGVQYYSFTCGWHFTLLCNIQIQKLQNLHMDIVFRWCILELCSLMSTSPTAFILWHFWSAWHIFHHLISWQLLMFQNAVRSGHLWCYLNFFFILHNFTQLKEVLNGHVASEFRIGLLQAIISIRFVPYTCLLSGWCGSGLNFPVRLEKFV